MHRIRSRFGLKWTIRLLAMALLAVPLVSFGVSSPAFATLPACPSGTAAVTNVSYVISNGTTSTTVTTILGKTQSGDSVTANFTIAPGCTNIQLTLVSYRAPGPTFDPNTANQQTVFDSQTVTFNAGPGTLQVFLPAGYYQVDFVTGAVIAHLGPANSSNFYGSRKVDHDNGGTVPTTTVYPACNLTAIITGPPKQLQVTVQDTTYGLQSVVVTELVNATVVVPTFTAGSAQSFMVVATKTDQTQTAYLGLAVTNTAGYVTNCDPAF